MMKNRFYKILLFAFIIIVLDQVIGFTIAHYAKLYKFDKRIELLINNKLQKDIFILGSSRALNDFNPSVINKNTPFSCYNLGVSGSNILFHETMLDLILQSNNHPKKIIYNVDDAGALINIDQQIIYRKDELYPYVNNPFINKKVSEYLDKELFATRLSSSYRNNINFVNASKYFTKGIEIPNPQTNNVGINGSNMLSGLQHKTKEVRYINRNKKHLIKDEYQPYREAFLRIISKCKQADIDLTIVFPPTYYTPTIKFRERITELIQNECLILDYATQFKDADLFYNHGHLNKKGATKFSQLLSKDLIAN